MTGWAVFLLAMVLASAAEAGLSSHSVSYDVKLPADAEKVATPRVRRGAPLLRSATYGATRLRATWFRRVSRTE